MLILEEEIENTKNETEKLKTVVATQSFSVNDIADIQKKTGYLDKEIKCLEKECEDYLQLLSRYDVEALGVRDKVFTYFKFKTINFIY